MRTIVSADAPAAIGPYSQAVEAGAAVFCSGQIALDPQSMVLVGNTTAEQTAQVLRNLSAVLDAAGLTLRHVVKTTVYLADMGDFGDMNEVYASFFGDHKPARAAIQAAALPKGALVEVECIAVRDTP